MAKKLTKPQMRVAIAQDVIEQVHAERYRGRCGIFVSAGSYEDQLVSEAVGKEQCAVCAIGGLMLSRFRLYNKEDVDCWDGDEMREILSEVFGQSQTETIEAAFELWDEDEMVDDHGMYDGHPAPDWCGNIADDTDRLLAIMQNIVDHGGEFRRDVEYEVK